jgi:hypothetical protein
MEKNIEPTPSLFLNRSEIRISECAFYRSITSEVSLPPRFRKHNIRLSELYVSKKMKNNKS